MAARIHAFTLALLTPLVRYNLLAEALNRPAGTSNHFSGDQASWARKVCFISCYFITYKDDGNTV